MIRVVTHVGFTGTRRGMTLRQHRRAYNCVSNLDLADDPVFHHGDCVGADAQFHDMLYLLGPPTSTRGVIHAHPGSGDPGLRACKPCDVMHPPLPYLVRNRDIVAASQVVIAAPAEMRAQQRGGTWSTIRLVIAAKKRLMIAFPDGGLYDSEDADSSTHDQEGHPRG